MADYNINKSNGDAVTITTGAIDNSFDIPFLGQDSINYGDDLATAMLRQLENFANDIAPSFGASRTIGQLWYDTTVGQGLKVWNGSVWDLLPFDTNIVHTTGAESIAGVKTFSSTAAFTSASAPFTVNSTTLVTNLNAQLLDGKLESEFASAAQGLLAENAEPDLLSPAGDGYLLASTTGGVRSWVAPGAGTGNVDPVDAAGDTTTTVLLYSEPTASGSLQPLIDVGGLTYNAGSGALTTTTFTGALNGNAATATIAASATTATIATTITVADTASATTWPVLAGAATGNQAPKTDGALTYNAATGALAATSFSGSGGSLTGLSAANISTGTLAVARGGTGVTTSTGSGANVLNTGSSFTGTIGIATINSATGTTLQYNTEPAIVTINRSATGNTSAAQVRSHNNTLEDIGFNTLPQFNWNASDTLEAGHCGHVTGQTGVGYTLTLEASGTTDFPVEGITTVINASALDYTITEGAGTTLFYLEGGAGATDTTGGCVIGAGGFSPFWEGEKQYIFPHIGGVIIGDDVEIQAMTNIDRGGIGNTIIGTNTKIDTQCHIGHNTRIGDGCTICAKTQTGGSNVIGDKVFIAPNVAIRTMGYIWAGGSNKKSDHITIGDGAFIGFGSLVVKDIKPGERVKGFPAKPF